MRLSGCTPGCTSTWVSVMGAYRPSTAWALLRSRTRTTQTHKVRSLWWQSWSRCLIQMQFSIRTRWYEVIFFSIDSVIYRSLVIQLRTSACFRRRWKWRTVFTKLFRLRTFYAALYWKLQSSLAVLKPPSKSLVYTVRLYQFTILWSILHGSLTV